jgi:hypothetical protein
LLAFVPRIANAHCNLGTVTIERDRGDRPWVFEILPKALLDLVIPDGDGTVGPSGREGVVDGVEGKGVDWPNVVDVVDGLPMTFERVFFLLCDG